jgi:hypothetical protein
MVKSLRDLRPRIMLMLLSSKGVPIQYIIEYNLEMHNRIPAAV